MKIFGKITHPSKPFLYAVTTGAYVGELLAYVEDNGDNHGFLSMTNMINRSIPKDKFKLGLDSHIVDIVEKLPRSIHRVCVLQYKKNINLK